ncbi:hypothetical protein W97_01260 [Coniosporium apollinis CBS 100218]|uniref:SET domain-containing protein n=1 Tax=Coniosporium apollinis (strain CBS 100218) TaxID=1168221 RepID=R7YK95_CONA1|nr:uncharacterized protein W97_01260 [Coniosporium apollinis CBS 100218]EON62041.1 hypothetical protein W97_01260 [Coniosporium apollinis CBS 100218]
MSDDEWSALQRLESHLEAKRARGGSQWQEIEVLALGAWRYSDTKETIELPTAQQISCAILTNALTIVTPTFDPLGVCLNPFAALANHSCDPNAVVVMDGPELSFRSLKPIAKDEEVLISYIDVTNPLARRQEELKERYHFTCACSKCQKDPTGPEDKFLKPPKKLMKKWATLVDDLKKAGSVPKDDPANYVGDDIASERMAVLQGMAFSALQTARGASGPRETIAGIENGMRLCYQCGMFPVYRQPYAQMRHNLFINMLTVGNFPIAWAQGVKTYFLIDPVLFPQTYHPVRVVHTWTLAMLTLYIASEYNGLQFQQSVGSELDLGIIIYGLLAEVYGNVQRSHGHSSSFAKLVQRKFEEVKVDMTRGFPDALRGMEGRVEKHWKLFRHAADWMQY